MNKEMQKLTWMQFRAALDGGIRTVILPIGTVEAHGATVLGTDNLIPESIASYLAEQIDALIAPTINYGITKSLYGYPGSLTVTPETFGQYVRDVLDSLADAGFERIIVLNGHGGNDSVLKDVAYNFFYDSGVKIAVIQWWELCEDVTNEVFGETGGHAGIDETAMMQAIDKSLVDKSQFNKDLVYTFNPAAYVYPIPGSILLYKDGEGIPDFDSSRAKDFQKKAFEKVSEYVKFVLDRWDLIESFSIRKLKKGLAMCKVTIILVAILTVAPWCFGQSAFLDYGKNGVGMVASANYITNDYSYSSNTGAATLGCVLSFGGRTDLEVGVSRTFSDESANTGPFGIEIGDDPSTLAFSLGTEIFLYKGNSSLPIMYSIGASFALSETIGLEGAPIILYIKTSKNDKSYMLLSGSLIYYDTDIEKEHSSDYGKALGVQALLFARTSDKMAITLGPSFAFAEYFDSYTFLLGLLFI